MLTDIAAIFAWTFLIATCLASIYICMAAIAMLGAKYRASRSRPVRHAGQINDAISILKPLCGDEPGLYANLATFCELAHPRYELLMGTSSHHDPAIDVVKRLQVNYPELRIRLIVDSRVHGNNLKVSNLINLSEHAQFDTIVIADSDIAVAPGYLHAVCAPLADPAVGIVTCLYTAHGIGGLWTRMGALFVDQWFAPSVRVAHALGSRQFGFGATLALRRSTLSQIGGFYAIKDHIADDFWLAASVRQLGLRVQLSEMLVVTDVVEKTPRSLLEREVRWLRTIRSLRPRSFAFLFITFTCPWLAADAGFAAFMDFANVTASHRLTYLLLFTSMVFGSFGRLLLHFGTTQTAGTFWRDLPLLLPRDLILAWAWLIAFAGSRVVWRGARLQLDPAEELASGQKSRPLETFNQFETTDGA